MPTPPSGSYTSYASSVVTLPRRYYKDLVIGNNVREMLRDYMLTFYLNTNLRVYKVAVELV